MLDYKRTFIITSVICFSNKKLNKATPRSVFSPEERTKQTIKTINSVREKLPDATIMLIEMGNERNIAEELVSIVDKYVFIGDHSWVKWAVNGKFKGLGEAVGLIISRKEVFNDADFFFKLSGRYFLNEQFEPAIWQGDFFLAKKYGTGISTRFYGFNKKYFSDWQKALRRSLLKLYMGRSIEDVFPAKFGRERIHDLKKMGVAGYVAPNGEYLEE